MKTRVCLKCFIHNCIIHQSLQDFSLCMSRSHGQKEFALLLKYKLVCFKVNVFKLESSQC